MKLPKGIRELKRQKIVPVTVMNGDTLSLIVDGEPVLSTGITEYHHFTEGLLFEADPGVLGEGRGLGGAFIEEKK